MGKSGALCFADEADKAGRPGIVYVKSKQWSLRSRIQKEVDGSCKKDRKWKTGRMNNFRTSHIIKTRRDSRETSE